eukprot:Phypoly_transcript_03011.p1 GENE.Phypoly_transcript_03011~~Phypoly_transcript_03011.p1  ORF type:complete len:682 (+),score=151.61 Phypoly_transcript_03011:514-2559(+)
MYVLILHPETLRPVPLGGIGEIVVGGVGVARGYTDPEITKQKFLKPNDVLRTEILQTLPTKEINQGRLYRTGDLGRWQADGVFHCVGRMDSQVKLRGYRIELDGISATLCKHPSVANAAVIMHSPIPSDPLANQLIAFVELTSGGSEVASEEVLRTHISSALPIYMQPEYYIIGPLPRGTSGKIDKKALVVPDLNNSPRSSSKIVVEPSNAEETDLLHIFLDILRISKTKSIEVGVMTNFFELGGNSLHAARLLARINARFGVSLSVRTFFSAPTVRSLAVNLGLVTTPAPSLPSPQSPSLPSPQSPSLPSPLSSTTEKLLPSSHTSLSFPPPLSPATEKTLPSHPSSLLSPTSSRSASLSSPLPSSPKLQSTFQSSTTKTPLVLLREGEPDKPTLFCMHPAGGSAMAFFPLAQEVHGFRVYGLEDINESGEEGVYKYASIDEMAQDYVNAIQTVQPHGPYYLAGFSMGGVVSYTMAAMLESKGEKVQMVVVIDNPVREDTEQAHEIADLQATEVLLALVHGTFNKFAEKHEFLTYSSENGTANGTAQNGHGAEKPANGHANGKTPVQATLDARWDKIRAIAAQDPVYARFVSIFHAHLTLLRSHAMTSLPYSGPVLLLVCHQNNSLYAPGWQALCENRVEVLTLPYGVSHLQVLLQPCVEYVASFLSSRLKFLDASQSKM